MKTSPCNHEVRRTLTGLPTVYEDCEAALLPMKRPLQQRISVSRTGTGITLQEDAVTARSDILGALSVWSAMVADEQAVSRPRRRRPRDLAWFLLSHLDWLLRHPAGPDFGQEILEVARRAEHVVHRTTAPPVDLGSCIQAGCGEELRLSEPEDAERDTFPVIRCTAGHSWPPNQWLYLSRRSRRER